MLSTDPPILGPDGLWYIYDYDAGLTYTYGSYAEAQTAVQAATNPRALVDVGFIFMDHGTGDMRRVFQSADGAYWIGGPRTYDSNTATPYAGTPQSMRDWIAQSYTADRALAAQQDAAFQKQMVTVFTLVGAAVGAAALLGPSIASGGVAATDSATAVSASTTEIPGAAGWVSSGDLPFTATEAAGGTISAPTSILLSDTPSWMNTASTVAKATAGAVTSGGGISAGGVLSTLATIAKALTGGAKPAVRSGINPATGLPFDSSTTNAQSIQGMLPYLLIGGLALIALRGK